MPRRFCVFVTGACLAIGTASRGAEKEPLRPFAVGKFLQISSSSPDFVVEDLKVQAAKDSFMGRLPAKAVVNIKNQSAEKRLQVSVAIVLYDGQGNLVAAGSYSSLVGFGGFAPREAKTVDIQLGYFDGIEDAKFYATRVFGFLEEPRRAP